MDDQHKPDNQRTPKPENKQPEGKQPEKRESESEIGRLLQKARAARLFAEPLD